MGNQIKRGKQPCIVVWSILQPTDKAPLSVRLWREKLPELLTRISKAERVTNDRDGRIHGGKQDDLVLRCIKQTEYKLHPRWEQMECEFLLWAHTHTQKWDNSPQLIHYTLKTHYSVRRKLKKKSCSPRCKETLCLRWRPRHELPGFPCVRKFFNTQFSRFGSLSLLMRSCVRALMVGTSSSPGHPLTRPPVKHTHTHRKIMMNTHISVSK